MKKRNRYVPATAANRGFTLLEVMAAIGILVLGLVAVLAVFVARVPVVAKSQETKTAALAMRSIASALQLAFATPINPEADPFTGTWDPEGGPKIRIDLRGLYLTSPEDPEGFVVIPLPGPPDPLTLPKELGEVRWPRRDNEVYSLARPARPADPTGDGSGDPPTGPVEVEPIDLMRSYSYSITFKNWRRRIRTKVPSLSDSGTTAHPDTKSARIRPYNIQQENDEMQLGSNLGYEVTVRIYRNYSPRTLADLAEKRESPSMILKQTFLFRITTGFGVTR